MTDTNTNTNQGGGKFVPIVDPNPARRKRVVEIFNEFLEDKICLAELQGISREKLFSLAEAGWIKFKHGRIDEAFKIYQSLIVLDHRNAYFHSVMGAIHQKRKRLVEAVVEYTRAVQLNPRDISSFVNRGEIYLRIKNYKKAAVDFKNAILLDMSGRNPWANRARSLVIALKRSMESKQKKPV